MTANEKSLGGSDSEAFLDPMQCTYQLCIYIVSYSKFVCKYTPEQKKCFVKNFDIKRF